MVVVVVVAIVIVSRWELPMTFTPRPLPEPEPTAAEAVAGLPGPALVTGEFRMGAEVVYEVQGYVDWADGCSEDLTITVRSPEVEGAGAGVQPDEGFTTAELVRSGGVSFVRTSGGSDTDTWVNDWVDVSGPDGNVMLVFTPVGMAMGSANALGVCGLADLPMWVGASGGADTWPVDSVRAQAYMNARHDMYLDRLLGDPTLSGDERRAATWMVGNMRADGVYDADYGAMFDEASVAVVGNSVSYVVGDPNDPQVSYSWTFTPTTPRAVDVPDGATPWVPEFSLE
jgi:hypothetical protein